MPGRQRASAFCALGQGNKGACKARSKQGEACGSGPCEFGLDCVDGVCAVPLKSAGAGEPCAFDGKTAPFCGAGLMCYIWSDKTCHALRKAGEACDACMPECDYGLHCGASGTCTPLSSTLAKSLEACGGNVQGGDCNDRVLCEDGNCCDDNGWCMPVAAEGMPCNADQNQLCAYPLSCVGKVCTNTAPAGQCPQN